MRRPRHRQRRRARADALSALVALALLAGPSPASAQSSSSSAPKLNYNALGSTALLGAFTSLDYASPNASAAPSPSAGNLLTRSSTSDPWSLAGSAASGGSFRAVCELDSRVYVGGSFDEVDGRTGLGNVAVWSEADGWAPLGQGVDGPVNALWCDDDRGEVWLGGVFERPLSAGDADGYGGNLAMWSASSSSWSPAPIGGFSGPVASLSSLDSSTLLLSGSFTTRFSSNSTTTSPSSDSSPSGNGTIGSYASALSPISLSDAQIVGGPNYEDAAYGNPDNLVCSDGNPWIMRDGNGGTLTVRWFRSVTVAGFRLANTDFQGRGTTGFSIVSIPDNAALELVYNDPSSPDTNATCTNLCPLPPPAEAPYVDFLFPAGPQTLTGFELYLSEWTGASPGLDALQVLGDGASAYAVSSLNNGGSTCSADNNTASVSTSGAWTQSSAPTGIAGTTAEYLSATFSTSISHADAPSITFTPYVSATGVYHLRLVIPGCQGVGDCASRTSVQVTVTPSSGADPTVTTVSQAVDDDAQLNVYTGTVEASSDGFNPTIMLTLAANPDAVSGDQYIIVADRLSLVLQQADATLRSTSVGFGAYEYALGGNAVNASAVLSNSTETPTDRAAISLAAALGLRSSSSAVGNMTVHAIARIGSTTFLAGAFASPASANVSFTNLVAHDGAALVPLADNGVDGPVYALAVYDNKLYLAGDFRTAGSVSASNIAVYDPSANAFAAVAGGVDGPVAGLSLAGDNLWLSGNFSTVLDASGSQAVTTGGAAYWDAKRAAWGADQGVVYGDVSAVQTTSDGHQLFIGAVSGSSRYSASGAADLTSEGIKPLSGLRLSAPSITSSSPSSARRRRSTRSSILSWLSARQPSSNPSPPSIPMFPAPAPAVLAGAYAEDGPTFLGGNFSAAGGDADNFAVYRDGAVDAPAGGVTVDGVVQAIAVVRDYAFVGGDFRLEGGGDGVDGRTGLGAYDWKGENWLSLDALTGTGTVYALATRPSQDILIVAGEFNGVGSVSSPGVLAWDASSKQFDALGSGLSGTVRSIAFAGDNAQYLIAAGSFSLGGSVAFIAQFDFDSRTWSNVGATGDLPGPATAVASDDLNANSIWVAGQATSGADPYLLQWNGSSWTDYRTSLQSGTGIQQLMFVPLEEEHDVSGPMEKNRMLLTSGALSLGGGVGDVSSALFDGQLWHPFVSTTGSGGAAGSIAALINSKRKFSFDTKHYLGLGIIILISLAISLGIVFLLTLIGFIFSVMSRRSDSYPLALTDADEDEGLHRPSSLLEHINHATSNMALGGAGGGAGAAAAGAYAAHEKGEKGDHGAAAGPVTSDAGSSYEAYGAPYYDGDNNDGVGHRAYARYDFAGDQEGELRLAVGQQVQVLDSRDRDWWYVRDPANGAEGVCPSSYLF